MRPFINWAGSREKDLGVLVPLVPEGIKTFVDPFVGDGALFLAVKAKSYVLAANNEALIGAWRAVQEGGPRLRGLLPELADVWERADGQFEAISKALLELKGRVDMGLYADYPARAKAVVRIADLVPFGELFPTRPTEALEFCTELRYRLVQALDRMDAGTDEKTAETVFYTAFKEAVFHYLVELYNKPASKFVLRSALLIFLMEFAKGDRYMEVGGEFRPEYGGRKVNRRDIRDRIGTVLDPALARKMEVTKLYRQDLFRTLGYEATRERDSFLFLDLPEGCPRAFLKRTAAFLKGRTEARWMVICRPEDGLAESPGGMRCVPLGDELVVMNY